ncbi:CopG family transcriptional regulator [Rickettsia endosymbiont of Cantharis rufa]|uniref:CopG family transcriptional regulator n=1 Tax=Rickettsia endosymbiont of Cantharis rufa TaxID=3066248 RepID=UPI003132BEBC
MSKRIKYTDGEIGAVKIVKDLLPHPKGLLLKETSVKVTISLSEENVEFFRSEAAHSHVSYQKMIKVLLDKYTKHYKEDKRA